MEPKALALTLGLVKRRLGEEAVQWMLVLESDGNASPVDLFPAAHVTFHGPELKTLRMLRRGTKRKFGYVRGDARKIEPGVEYDLIVVTTPFDENCLVRMVGRGKHLLIGAVVGGPFCTSPHFSLETVFFGNSNTVDAVAGSAWAALAGTSKCKRAPWFYLFVRV